MATVMSIRNRALQSRAAVEVISDKWRIPVIHILRDGSLRTSQIQSAIADVSPKVLTQTLRGMERDGLIRRDVFPVVPPRVEYSLTAMGKSLIKPLEELCRWAKNTVADRDAARERFDGSDASAKLPRRKQARGRNS